MTRSTFRSLVAATLLAGGLLCLLPASAFAGNDPSIQGRTRTGVNYAMQAFIQDRWDDERFMTHYDPVAGKLLRLRLMKLHDGIVKKGDFFVSCADFEDPKGRKYDLDFLVLPKGDLFQVNQASVHAAEGKKRKYHVE